MNITIVTTCTNRKKHSPLITSANICHGDQDSILKGWQTIHKIASQKQNSLTPVYELYCGRSFQEILLSKQESAADLWIISTGLGLIHWKDKVPSYNLTLTQGSDDCIQRKVTGAAFDAVDWWKKINANRQFESISSLVISKKDDMFLIPLSFQYLKMVQCDLLSLNDKDLSRVRIFGLLHSFNLHPRLRAVLLPYDERINDPKANNQGTRTDFAARCVRHFINKIIHNSRQNTLEEHHNLVVKSLAHLKRPVIEKRTKLPDDEIIKIIKIMFNNGITSSQAMLRKIRSGYHIACEQQRFAALVRKTKKDLLGEE